MTTAPEAYQDIPSHEPSGLIGFPINALLDWPMATQAGYHFFANALINQQFKKILDYWAQFLQSPASRYVLNEPVSRLDQETLVVPWLGKVAKAEMVKVANEAVGEGPNPTPGSFEQIFECEPAAEYHGFRCWDDFFTRRFRVGVRPVSAPTDDSVIVNACESAPLQVRKEVSCSDQFWLKGQPYSLDNMLDFDDLAPRFEGGTVYQAFLSALSYHRWHSPVSGTIRKVRIVNGTYYLENQFEGFADPQGRIPAPQQFPAVPHLGGDPGTHLHRGRQPQNRPDVRGAGGDGRGVELRDHGAGGGSGAEGRSARHVPLRRLHSLSAVPPRRQAGVRLPWPDPGLDATNMRLNTAIARVK